jgi:hypothetical protein
MPATTTFPPVPATPAAAPAAIAHARVVAAARRRLPGAGVVIRSDRSRAPGRR